MDAIVTETSFVLQKIIAKDPLEACSVEGEEGKLSGLAILDCLAQLETREFMRRKKKAFKELARSKGGDLKLSIDEPLELELKRLPKHLEYTFLVDNSKLLVIIVADLEIEQKYKQLQVLREHKTAIV